MAIEEDPNLHEGEEGEDAACEIPTDLVELHEIIEWNEAVGGES